MVPVHYGGQACDMPALQAIADEFGLFVVDDAAHALPATFGDRKVGAMGCPTAFSFYATKTLTTGEGGMLTTDDDALAARARVMALHGITRDAWKRYTAAGSWFYEVSDAGYKYNLTDIAAALGRVQLRRLHEMQAGRARIAARYGAAFATLDAVEPLATRPGWATRGTSIRSGSGSTGCRSIGRGSSRSSRIGRSAPASISFHCTASHSMRPSTGTRRPSSRSRRRPTLA